MNVAVFRPGTLGDLVLTKPLFDYLFHKFNKKIYVISENNKSKNLLNDITNIVDSISKFIIYDNKLSRIKLFVALISLINNNDISVIYIVPPRGKNILSGLIHRLSFFLIGIVTNCKVIYPKISFYNLFSKTSSYNEYERISLYYPKISRKDFLNQDSDVNNCVVIFYGAKFLSKTWPDNYYLELIEAIIENYSYNIHFFCLSKDSKIIQILTDKKYSLRFNLHIDMSLVLIKNYVKNAIKVICCDTGTMHFSALYNSQLICIFSDRDRDNWSPIRSSIILRHRVRCGGCMLEVCNKNNHECLESITPQLVLSHI